MALSPQERGRYARHLLLPEIGLSGQECLVRARYRVAPGASPFSAEFARTYLDRAGLREGASWAAENGASDAEEGAEVTLDLPNEQVLREVASRPELVPAASALMGALCAVEAVKGALALGTPMPLFDLLPPSGEERSAGPAPDGRAGGHLSLSVEDV